jgi:hypothetical protein
MSEPTVQEEEEMLSKRRTAFNKRLLKHHVQELVWKG